MLAATTPCIGHAAGQSGWALHYCGQNQEEEDDEGSGGRFGRRKESQGWLGGEARDEATFFP